MGRCYDELLVAAGESCRRLRLVPGIRFDKPCYCVADSRAFVGGLSLVLTCGTFPMPFTLIMGPASGMKEHPSQLFISSSSPGGVYSSVE